MSEMIEQVARAIWWAEYNEDLPPEGTRSRARSYDMARAAIITMGHLTEAMEEAGADCIGSFSRRQALITANEVWEAMIEAAVAPVDERRDGQDA